jgi:uncharacterized protein with HEPN domain
MSKDYVIFLKHILQSIKNIEEDTKGFSKEKFFSSRTIQDAVIRNIEIIGEAARNLPYRLRTKYNHIPWIDIIAMRNKLIHAYFGIDLNVVWQVIKRDLPTLKEQIKEILEKKNT